MLKGMPIEFFDRLERAASPDVESFKHASFLTTGYSEQIWKMRFGSVEREVNWRVRFGSGFLTDANHTSTRNIFQSWVIAQTHPSVTNGRLLDDIAAKRVTAIACRLVDYFLLHQDELKLAKHGMRVLTENDFASLLYRFETCLGDHEAIYDWTRRLGEWLDERVRQSLDAVTALVERHAFLSEFPTPREEWTLAVEPERLAEWRAVLLREGFYNVAKERVDYRFSPATTRLAASIYVDTIAGHGVKPVFEELCLVPVDKYAREYCGVDVRTGEGEAPSNDYVSIRRRVLLSLSTLSRVGFDVPVEALEAVRQSGLVNPASIAKPGRYRNPPIWQVIDGIKNGTEFTLTFGLDLFDSYVNILKAARDEHVTPHELTLRHDIRQFLTKGAIDMGITKWCLRTHADSRRIEPMCKKRGVTSVRWERQDFFPEFRRRRGLLQNIQVFYGGCQHVIGPVTARRRAELLRLPVLGCLDASREYIVFKNGKSGAAGVRQEEVRPIPPIIATQISLVEHLHTRLVDVGVLKVPGLLFSTPGFRGIVQPTETRFNAALDVFCDFFETPLNRDGQRYYLREHQFRRFLIIAFFFGARQSNLETLRWFIGHTDAAHLWHYLTNTVSGDMHREAAAYFLTDELQLPEEERVVEIHEHVREELATLVEARFQTREYALIDAETLEDYLKILLEKNITVEPVFFPAASKEKYKIIVSLKERK
ncbi:hypothetical protein M3I54_40730 [Paraburkholderia sp. CNPSo 3274]|uniref:hypothetical protein n=1 Tax=Paraburkholderia sp. CNPSo 3274 TaxID=2940932 RepID=UPI0020B71CA0|nr:hypothetical protein [Paraburkholderia sp. CNPSo 3274]MCP3713137.1 hypothetical protein [Paraburkholderia sp. CNPSo 3274]